MQLIYNNSYIEGKNTHRSKHNSVNSFFIFKSSGLTEDMRAGSTKPNPFTNTLKQRGKKS